MGINPWLAGHRATIIIQQINLPYINYKNIAIKLGEEYHMETIVIKDIQTKSLNTPNLNTFNTQKNMSSDEIF